MSPGAVRSCGTGLMVLTLLGAAPLRDKGGDKETVQVSVIVILATERNNQVDPKLANVAREVHKTHEKLTGFRIVTLASKSLTIGAKDTFELVEDQKAAVTVERAADAKNRVQVRVAPPRMGEITYDTCCGKFLPIVTPFRTANNELLILAVRVQPCHEK